MRPHTLGRRPCAFPGGCKPLPARLRVRDRPRSCAFAALAVGALCLLGAGAGTAEPLSVLTSVVPQATFAERIGGDAVRVEAVVGQGQSPHAYEPSPRQVARMGEADLYWRIGVPFEDAWLPRIRAANPGIEILDAREGIALRPSDSHAEAHDEAHDQGQEDAHDGHDHGPLDSHVWTGPPLVKAMAERLAERLSALRPERAETFAANYARFAADVDALDRDIRERLAGLDERRFLVFHPAWGYFADTYGLTQIPIERLGKEPGARALAETIETARAADIRTILVQPQMDRRAAERVADAVGARVATVDPLAADWFATLRGLADLIAGGAADAGETASDAAVGGRQAAGEPAR